MHSYIWCTHETLHFILLDKQNDKHGMYITSLPKAKNQQRLRIHQQYLTDMPYLLFGFTISENTSVVFEVPITLFKTISSSMLLSINNLILQHFIWPESKWVLKLWLNLSLSLSLSLFQWGLLSNMWQAWNTSKNYFCTNAC